ncbi:MAG TPA: TonB-dependent receptor [Chryseosolibacter sp.]|nr:TonB-dependent receptor [Chryseosolibacter sp.]
MRNNARMRIVTLLCFCVSNLYAQHDEMDSLFNLSLEDLMKINITTASNKTEQLNKAPATIIVITEKDIHDRGYLEFYDILNDLPGFDLSRAFGDDNYYLYPRGYRKSTGDVMLLMVDGIIMNHLYNNNMNAFFQYPLNNIKQVEVVYGPASAIYGPNAFAGVINIITKTDGKSSLRLSAGHGNTNIADLHFSQNLNSDVSLNITGKFYSSGGPDLEGRTPFLHDSLYRNKALWGPLMSTDFIGYHSPMRSHYFAPSLTYKGLTVGMINYFSESGLGTEFPGDQELNSAKWQFRELTTFVRYNVQVNDKLSSKTLFKIRRSDIPGSSMFIYRWPNDGANFTNGAMNAVEYWQSVNMSFSFFNDFTYTVNERFTTNFGLKYDRRLLQREYEIIGTYDDVTDSVPNFPTPPQSASIDQHNHGLLEDRGLYFQGKYSFSEKFDLVGGLRYDYNTVWKDVFSPRIGVVVEPVSNLIFKGFFGTAFLEPSARVLYGGWSGTLSNPDVQPEKMRTIELSASYTINVFSAGLNFYRNSVKDAIVVDSEKRPFNLGSADMTGIDAYFKVSTSRPVGMFNRLSADMFVSWVDAEEQQEGFDAIATPNMAPLKIKLIGTATLARNITFSVQSRYIDEIKTVSSNPLAKIDSWFAADANLLYRNLLVDGFSLGVKVYNITDKKYDHPGYRDASAGEDAYIRDDQGAVTGRKDSVLGGYSSRLPQPLRTIMLTFRYEL